MSGRSGSGRIRWPMSDPVQVFDGSGSMPVSTDFSKHCRIWVGLPNADKNCIIEAKHVKNIEIPDWDIPPPPDGFMSNDSLYASFQGRTHYVWNTITRRWNPIHTYDIMISSENGEFLGLIEAPDHNPVPPEGGPRVVGRN